MKEWCEFHRTYGHHTEQCLTLANQLQRLRGETREGRHIRERDQVKEPCRPKDQADHISPVLGDLNTIASGFLGRGVTSASRKRYARSVMTTSTTWQKKTMPTITFTEDDRSDVMPHEDDLVVVSIIAMGRRVHQVLID